MRKLLLLALLSPTLAFAEPIFVTSTTDGGVILLTDESSSACKSEPNNQWRLALLIAPSGKTLRGCWQINDYFVHVLWSDGDEFNYLKDKWEYIGHDKKNNQEVPRV